MHDRRLTQARPTTHDREIRLSRRTLVGTAAGFAAFASVSPAVLGAQSTPEADSGTGPVMPLYPHGQQITLDPHRAINWGPHWTLLPYVWAGLLGFDERGSVIPVLASSVEPEEDGLVWVASIRPEVTFASGNPVTADALISGWKRALRPQRTAPMARYMRRVEGYDAYIAAESEEIGFEARDERTVAIRLSEPYGLFREDLATFVWAAVDTSAVDSVSESQVPYSGASAGMWRFIQDVNADDIVMVAREDASSLPSSFNRVTWRPMEGPLAADDALDSLRAGEFAVADAPAGVRNRAQNDENLRNLLHTIEPAGSTMLVGMDFRQAPFDDPRVRRAIAHAIDREQWATEIMGGSFEPAQSITPPVIAENANYSPPEPLAFDPDLARSLIEEAGISEDAMPTILYFQPANAPQDEIDQAAALIEMITENTGLVIEHDLSLTAEQISARRNDDRGLQFDLRWWWPMTNSLSGLVDLGSPDSDAMDGWFNWSGSLENAELADAAEEYAELVANAQLTMDSTERTQMFARAEALLIENVVYVPLGHAILAYVQSPRLTGTRQGAFTGYMPVAFDEDVSWTPPEESTPTA